VEAGKLFLATVHAREEEGAAAAAAGGVVSAAPVLMHFVALEAVVEEVSMF
jgi:hypothetical protein